MSPFVRAALLGFAITAALAFLTWLVSLKQRDVSLVDRMWSLMIALPAFAYAWALPGWNERSAWMVALLAIWAVRLAVYVSWRNWGHGEDRRYQVIRARNEPNFPAKSLVLIFLLQAVLAWLVSTPLLAVFAYPRDWSPWFDSGGASLAVFGIVYSALADWQLAVFKARPANRGKVMDRGLWRHTRHPNYFGEFCVWWGFFVMALPPGWWSVVSPVIMSVLLLKVSGAALLEKDIGERRPAYRDYIARTPAFFPGPLRTPR